MSSYRVLNKQVFCAGDYSIVPIRMQDRYDIMRWRNEQMYHLRQKKPLTPEEQDRYFDEVVSKLFDQEKPDQILFSYLQGDKCIGYGGLVHINWEDRHAEVSFIMDTRLEKDSFELHWQTFLGLIDQPAFEEIKLHKIFTYAYDLRPRLYTVLENNGFIREATLKDHCLIENKFVDVVIHSRIRPEIKLRKAQLTDAKLTFKWARSEAIRQYAFTKTEISWENHQTWFREKINNEQCLYYILEKNGQGIGSIRFDLDADGKARISYLLDPDSHGKGLGKVILELGMNRLKGDQPNLRSVFGDVMEENMASIKTFERLGFLKTREKPGQYRFEKKLKE